MPCQGGNRAYKEARGAGPEAGDKPVQLRDVASLLRKSDEPQGVLRGLRLIGPLLLQAPDELRAYAGSLPFPLTPLDLAGLEDLCLPGHAPKCLGRVLVGGLCALVALQPRSPALKDVARRFL